MIDGSYSSLTSSILHSPVEPKKRSQQTALSHVLVRCCRCWYRRVCLVTAYWLLWTRYVNGEDFVSIAPHIQKKILLQQDLTIEDRECMDATKKMLEASKKPLGERVPLLSVDDSEQRLPFSVRPPVGSRISVYWDGDKKWFKGYVSQARLFHLISYDDNRMASSWPTPVQDSRWRRHPKSDPCRAEYCCTTRTGI